MDSDEDRTEGVPFGGGGGGEIEAGEVVERTVEELVQVVAPVGGSRGGGVGVGGGHRPSCHWPELPLRILGGAAAAAAGVS